MADGPENGKVELSPATLGVVRAKAAAGCFMCRRVLEAMDGDYCLRDWPPEGPVEFPVEGQRFHVLREIGK